MVITVNIIINYLWEHLEFFTVLVLFCYGYYGGLKILFGTSPKGEKKRV